MKNRKNKEKIKIKLYINSRNPWKQIDIMSQGLTLSLFSNFQIKNIKIFKNLFKNLLTLID